jgi:hypothetical protein
LHNTKTDTTQLKTKADITEDIILIIYMTTFVITNIIMTVVVLQENITDLRLMELMELLEHLELMEHLELISQTTIINSKIREKYLYSTLNMEHLELISQTTIINSRIREKYSYSTLNKIKIYK